MRIALISMAGDGAGDVRLAGQPIAWHQLQAAIALACERILCLADRPGPDLALLQHEAERRGASFHAIAHHRALSGLVRAADTLVVFAPGVLPDRDWLAQTFGARAGVAVLPADGAVERGFERIDRERAWAGVLATRGDAVEALGSLAPDADPIAGLLRVALQRGAGGVAVPDKWLDDDRWALVASPAAAERYQADWYRRHLPPPSLDRPGATMAHTLARHLAGRVSNAASTTRGLAAAGVIVAAFSAAAGYLGHTAAGLIGLALASGTLAVAGGLNRLSRAGTGEVARAWPGEARRGLLDVALLAVAVSPSAFGGWTTAFAALVLIAAIRLANEPGAPRVMRPLSDRTAVFLLLAVAAAAGVFAQATALAAVLALAARLFWPSSKELTRL